jgi:hypothetical protein
VHLAPPTDLKPEGGAEVPNTTPTLSWSPVPNATNYRVQISRDQSFSNLLLNETTGGKTSFQVPEGVLYEGHTYYWRVRAGSSYGQSEWAISSLKTKGITDQEQVAQIVSAFVEAFNKKDPQILSNYCTSSQREEIINTLNSIFREQEVYGNPKVFGNIFLESYHYNNQTAYQTLREWVSPERAAEFSSKIEGSIAVLLNCPYGWTKESIEDLSKYYSNEAAITIFYTKAFILFVEREKGALHVSIVVQFGQ